MTGSEIAPPEVDIELGWVAGIRTTAGRAWLGIPYARPPVGPLRLREPLPAERWTGVRDCTRLPHPAVQFTLPGVPPAEQAKGSEDCLTLNVWTPGVGSEPRPVLVWIHGGGFVAGSGAFFDGTRLAAATGCVVVTLNYRLGPLGFLYLDGLAGSDDFASNIALRDIIAALEFVGGNISGFGGDPGNMTIFGESAGAMLIGALLGSPRAKGLFAKAALFSGAASNVHPADRATEIARYFLGAAGLRKDGLADLRQIPIDALRRAAAAVNDRSVELPWNSEAFLPVVGDDILPVDPLAAVAGGSGASVPLLISVLRDEMNLFLQRVPSLCTGKEVYNRDLLGGATWERLEAEYAAFSDSPESARRDLLTDAMFSVPAIRLAEAYEAAGGRSFMMRIDAGLDLPPYDQLGPCHGQDVGMIWDDYVSGGAADSIVTGGSARDKAAAAAVQGLLASFATGGTPSVGERGDWERYRPERRCVFLLDRRSGIVVDPASARRRAWEGLLAAR